jgi:uncharacterized radical SAM protein YgiQ
MSCPKWERAGACPDRHCAACPSLDADHGRQADLLQRIREIPKVRHVFISSGVRYDLIPADDEGYLDSLCEHHVSGHLKVAPEHISPRVTACMNKPGVKVFDAFRSRFDAIQQGKKKRQYILPYFMSGHPGCTIEDMIGLALYIRDHDLYTEQVQDFTPTPMSVSTCMYYTGLDPFTMEPVHVPKGREKKIQRALLQYRDPKNHDLVIEGLIAAGRRDLIGSGPGALVPDTGPGLHGRKRIKNAIRGRDTRRAGRKKRDSSDRNETAHSRP